VPRVDLKLRDKFRREINARIREERARLSRGIADRLAAKSMPLRRDDEDIDLMPYAGQKSTDE
jgi:hypothetical protein